jgi:uncharacterized protein (TIGR03083 family)
MVPSQRYRIHQERFVELTLPLDDQLRLPATPDWTVQMVTAHLTGVAADLVNGNVQEWSEPQWTAAQVNARAGRARAELLGEWHRLIPQAAAILDDPQAAGLDEMFGRIPIIDLLGHLHDVAEAVGQTDLIIEATDWEYIGEHRRMILDDAVTHAGLAPLRVRTPEGDDWAVGGNPDRAEVTLPRQELWRSLTGRRSRSHVRGWRWSVDPTDHLAVWVSASFDWPDD